MKLPRPHTLRTLESRPQLSIHQALSRAMADAVFDGLSQWAPNFVNVTFIVPSGRDLFLAGPRMVYRILQVVSGAVEHIFGAKIGRGIFADATGTAEIINTSTADVTETIKALQSVTGGELSTSGLTSKMSLERARSLSSVVSYTTSKWALSSLLMSIVINRAYVYASTRRHVLLPWHARLLVRLVPMVMLLFQIRSLLQAILCQTSSEFVVLRQPSTAEVPDLPGSHEFLHTLSSILLLRPSDLETCRSIKMIPLESTQTITGSLSLLWPLYKIFCLDQIVETIVCAVEGRRLFAETCMSLFEHSLAFAEAEAAVGVTSIFGKVTGTFWDPAEATKIAFSRSMRLKQLNTTPEVLLLALLGAMNHVSSHVLAVFNLRCRFRLLHTGLWGIAFMVILAHSAWRFTIDSPEHHTMLKYPTVYLVGFSPHILVLVGIVACAVLYCAALCLAVLAPPRYDGSEDRLQEQSVPSAQLSMKQKFIIAHQNMQANVSLSGVRITMHHEFFTALLKAGFTLITMAAEAVYLCQSDDVRVKPRTWLEDDLSRKLSMNKNEQAGLASPLLSPTDALRRSPYNRQMTTKDLAKTRKGSRMALGDTTSRWIGVVDFQLRIYQVLLRWSATLALRVLSILGVQTRPRFLVSFLSRQPGKDSPPVQQDSGDANLLKRGASSVDGANSPTEDGNIDVEVEMRKLADQGRLGGMDEEGIDAGLYKYWLRGGQFGENDQSGDYVVKSIEEDMTSVISTAASDEHRVWESDDEEGARTPTQQSPRASREVSPVPDTPLTSSNLAQLLNPKTPEDREEAQTLAAHLTAGDNIMTRSRYRQYTQMEKARVLLPPNLMAVSLAKLTPDEEARILEHLIISKREYYGSLGPSAQSQAWAKGALGLGEGGPKCVVCQTSPRIIIVFPCKCLSLCDDCRVSLAMNNFDKCVCCRREVTSFSRIFVP